MKTVKDWCDKELSFWNYLRTNDLAQMMLWLQILGYLSLYFLVVR